ncbi:Threonyl/alanyl tRNA synthetase SAD [Desulfotomaculum nigrificans CO-1-SRB]|uniref:Threonyl/alanyl tRNA synthetase SAD n=1 Tax=Desulfotomaculum nigrificans (strain DSM 14880 / VKM B-2319 / CO-1-SRB) TaxID=868595 RepID=F6B7L2_DESCC|nr:alanine--tRNA ligase-related protein [Desulfotomaculum nigrificans]AEF94566.1 Threonyl/alanyl tRNA synthetase SAD [Desulfotomaculum nigrificans CO-1-SRB]
MPGIYDDPYIFQFRSNVIGSIKENGKMGVLLENTIFYPEGGGQPSDRGTMVSARRCYEVVHVEQRPEGIVHWLAGTSVPENGASVLMSIDADRRQDHMQQHHGQHIISAIFEQKYGWDTVGFHLGEETSTIDLTTDKIPLHVLQEVEEEANRVVMENLPVKIETYDREQLNPALLKKVPPDQEKVRLVTISGIDENACCGTHPRATGEVGPVKLLKTEKVRGNTRLHFICGLRTIRWIRQTAETLRSIEDAVGAVGSEAITRINNREAELKKLQKERKELLTFKYRHLADQLKEQALFIGDTYLISVQHFPDGDMELIRGVAAIWCEQPQRVAVLTAGTGPFDVVMARGAEVAPAMNQLAAQVWPILKGKGGGSADLVQGKAQELPAEQLNSLVKDFFGG